jgi:hypothetical protein
MTTLEERVRAATRAAGDTVAPDSVPPLRLPAGDPGHSRNGSRPSASVWSRRLAPLGAALAVVAVAVAMVTLGRTAHHSAPAVRPAPSGPGPIQAGPAAASYTAAGQVPPYYVSIESHGNPNFNPSYAVVRATATGARLATIAAPNHGTVVAATAAADDRTFILDEQPWVPPQSHANQFFEPRTFIMFRLDSSGQPGELSRLPISVPSGALMTGFSLSPDASKLAIAVEPNNDQADHSLQQIRLYSLATGAERVWSADGTIGFAADDARSLSWARDERTLAFDWAGNGPGVHVGIWLLDLRSDGGNLLAHSRQAVSLVDQAPDTASTGGYGPLPSVPSSLPSPSPDASPAGHPQSSCQQDSIITPDGTTIICGSIAATDQSEVPTSSGGVTLQRGAVTGFFEFSVVTGKAARILGYWRFGRVGALSMDVLWSNASGSVLIGVIPDSGGGRVGVIRGNEFTPLTVSAASDSAFSDTW